MMSPRELIEFFETGLWRIRLKDVTPSKGFWLRQLRILTLSLREFDRDKCMLRASALTFYSLLSVVPLIAMAYGIAKGFGLEQALETQIQNKFEDQQEVVSRILEFSSNVLAKAKGGIVAGIGVAILFWTVIKVLGNIESSFNDIWGVQRPRTWARKFSDYLAFVLISPIVFILAGSMTVAATVKITEFIDRLELWGWVGALIPQLLKLLPLCLVWGLFSFTYLFMPNTKVSFKSGLLGGIIAGTIYQIVQGFYVSFQVGVASYSAIYGSFAALPLFLIWLQMSWLIVLFGAEIAFSHQNIDTYEFEPDCKQVKPAFKRLLTLALVQRCIAAFNRGEVPPRAEQLARHFETPIRLINLVLFELTEARVLSEVRIPDSESVAYQPARSVDEMTVQGVLERLDTHGSENIPIADSPTLQALSQALEELRTQQDHSPANLRLKEL